MISAAFPIEYVLLPPERAGRMFSYSLMQLRQAELYSEYAMLPPEKAGYSFSYSLTQIRSAGHFEQYDIIPPEKAGLSVAYSAPEQCASAMHHAMAPQSSASVRHGIHEGARVAFRLPFRVRRMAAFRLRLGFTHQQRAVLSAKYAMPLPEHAAILTSYSMPHPAVAAHAFSHTMNPPQRAAITFRYAYGAVSAAAFGPVRYDMLETAAALNVSYRINSVRHAWAHHFSYGIDRAAVDKRAAVRVGYSMLSDASGFVVTRPTVSVRTSHGEKLPVISMTIDRDLRGIARYDMQLGATPFAGDDIQINIGERRHHARVVSVSDTAAGAGRRQIRATAVGLPRELERIVSESVALWAVHRGTASDIARAIAAPLLFKDADGLLEFSIEPPDAHRLWRMSRIDALRMLADAAGAVLRINDATGTAEFTAPGKVRASAGPIIELSATDRAHSGITIRDWSPRDRIDIVSVDGERATVRVFLNPWREVSIYVDNTERRDGHAVSVNIEEHVQVIDGLGSLSAPVFEAVEMRAGSGTPVRYRPGSAHIWFDDVLDDLVHARYRARAIELTVRRPVGFDASLVKVEG